MIIFLSLSIFGILKLTDSHYPAIVTSVVGTISFAAAIFIVIYTAKIKLLQSESFIINNQLWDRKKGYVIQALDLLMLLIGIIATLLVILLNYFQLINTDINDAIAIFTLAISLSNDLLATWSVRFIIYITNRKKRKYQIEEIA
ncbi:TPA: hypothetical protein QCR35_000907 [Bacillus cereus]|nr:hypothetical protein [Bacillus cereus]HDR4750818.1 hypothetical protein [Bacillus cereus]HDR4783984.1 hypothetical protein [Bacillus cereus]